MSIFLRALILQPYLLTKHIYRAAVKTVHDGVTDLASSMAFYLCFSIFPFVLALLSAAGVWMDSGDIKQQFQQLLQNTLPQSADVIVAQVEVLMKARGSMGLASILALLWSASAAFGAISRAINRAQGLPSPHNYVVARINYFFMALAVSALLLVCAAISGAVELLFAYDQRLMGMLGLNYGQLSRFGMWLTVFGILVLVFALIYRSAPNGKLRWRYIWRGALLAAVFNECAKMGFLWYLGHAAKLELLFGSLTGIMVMLMWFYIAGVGLIVGFEFALVLAEEHADESP